MTLNRTQIVQRIVWYDMLAELVKAESQRLRADLGADARAELEEQGTAATWRIPDVATVSARVSKQAAVVVDERRWAEWVQARYPSESYTVLMVREAWQKAFLERCGRHGGVVSDPDTGEVVPGLDIRPGGDVLGVSIRVSETAREVFGALARAGLDRLELEASPEQPVVLAEVESGAA